VSCAAASAIVAIDVASRRERGRHRIDSPLAAGGAVPVGMALARDGRTLFVAATMADRVWQLDAATLEPLRAIDVAGEPDGLAVTAVQPKARCHACVDASPDSTNEAH
jgi:sugar lactone lactonase YvrE